MFVGPLSHVSPFGRGEGRVGDRVHRGVVTGWADRRVGGLVWLVPQSDLFPEVKV